MDARQTTGGSRFGVDLGDVKLPPVIERRVEAEIQAVVLRALAEVDFRAARRSDDLMRDRFPDGTAGMILGPFGDWVPPWPTSDDPLTPQDHTTIVRAIMEHPLEVIQYLDNKRRDSRLSDTEVLEAALQVTRIDAHAKDRIRRVLEVLPQLEEARSRAPSGLDRASDELRAQIARRPIEEKVQTLRDRKARARYRSQPGFEDGMEVAAQILEAGATSIYSEDLPFYQMLREGKRTAREKKDDTLGTIADNDGIGAAIGGAIGTVAGGIGAGPGAVAGGAAASAGAAVQAVWDWLFD